MTPEIMSELRLGYSRDDYLRLADEHLNDAIMRLDGTYTIDQAIQIAEVCALMALATTRDPTPAAIAHAVDRVMHPADPHFVPALPDP